MKNNFKVLSFALLAFLFLFAGVLGSKAPLLFGQNTKTQVNLAYKSRAKIKQNTSENWAGYAATNGKYTKISGSWQIPNVKISNTFEMDATWVGIGGVNTDDLIQSGTQAITVNGKISYQAWVEMLPAASVPLQIDVHPGDIISVDISYENNKDTWLMDFSNQTTHKSVRKEGAYQSSFSSAEWIEEAPSDENGVLPLDQFGQVRFSQAYAIKNGTKLSVSKCGALAVGLAGDTGKLLASTSTLTSAGTSFLVSRTSTRQSIPKGRKFGPMSGWIHPNRKSK